MFTVTVYDDKNQTVVAMPYIDLIKNFLEKKTNNKITIDKFFATLADKWANVFAYFLEETVSLQANTNLFRQSTNQATSSTHLAQYDALASDITKTLQELQDYRKNLGNFNDPQAKEMIKISLQSSLMFCEIYLENQAANRANNIMSAFHTFIDDVFNVPNLTQKMLEQEIIKFLQQVTVPGVSKCVIAPKLYQPKSLQEAAVNFIKKNWKGYLKNDKAGFFKKLDTLPLPIREQHPELEINYKNLFNRAVEQIIKEARPNLEKNVAATTYLNKIADALAQPNSYNTVNHILTELRSCKDQALIDNLKGVNQKIFAEMKKYDINKEEYIVHIGRPAL